MRRLFLFMTMMLLLSCSSEKPGDISPGEKSLRSEQTREQTASPAVTETRISKKYALEVSPSEPYRTSSITVKPKGFDLSRAEIRWLVNGSLYEDAPRSATFIPRDLAVGDRVQALALVEGTEVYSDVLHIQNGPPEIADARITSEVIDQREMLSVDVQATDPDEDEITLEYEWMKNGEPAGTEMRIDAPVSRGDIIQVKIKAFDGQNYSRTVRLFRELRNLPPRIVTGEAARLKDGVYTYQAQATDPDGDTLTYALKDAPEGMTIDKDSGHIKWNVPPDVAGKKSFQIMVSDGNGGEALQTVTIGISLRKRETTPE